MELHSIFWVADGVDTPVSYKFRRIVWFALLATLPIVEPFSSRSSKHPTQHAHSPSILLFAKRNKNRADDAGLNQWYDAVDEDATPDEVFWEETERQRLFNQIGQGNSNDPYAVAASEGGSSSSSMPPPENMMGGSENMNGSPTRTPFANGGVSALPPPQTRKAPTMDQQKAAEATLVEYALYQVADNWLDEELRQQMEAMKSSTEQEDLSVEEETRRLEEQLEALPDGYGDQRDYLSEAEEPWDSFGREHSDEVDMNRQNIRQVPEPSPDSEFYLDLDEPTDPEERQRHEAEFWDRMKDCRITSIRVEKAKRSEKAKAFFSRDPDMKNGFDRLWVTAIDNACVKSLVGSCRDYGVEFADNFGDFQDGCAEDGLYTIEDVAAYKSRKVFETTGLPCIASRTSFEIEPVPPSTMTNSPGKASATTGIGSPRVLSGYRINDIGMHADYICDALRPMSEPDRVTRFASCLCFYDGEIEIFEYAECDIDLHYANSVRTYIPMAQAITNMVEGLEYQKFLQKRMQDALDGGSLGPASLKLRDRVLKDGKVLPNNIIDVSTFMDSQVDVNLMDECGKELVSIFHGHNLTEETRDPTNFPVPVSSQASRFTQQKPTKIMTIATTGLVIALPMAKYLQVPVIYARKERNVVMADTYKASYSSKTVGNDRELLVSKSHVSEHDRVLVVDDFLSSGAAQEALLTIISDAGATPVGIGVLLEKAYDCGRQSLSGFNIPIHSLCHVASVKDGSIQLIEEDGYNQM
eukprot:scaffold320_cov122-Cylindrotheca_fusiformis.AAC.2